VSAATPIVTQLVTQTPTASVSALPWALLLRSETRGVETYSAGPRAGIARVSGEDTFLACKGSGDRESPRAAIGRTHLGHVWARQAPMFDYDIFVLRPGHGPEVTSASAADGSRSLPGSAGGH
jgi:hypothetical protein